MTKQVKSRRGTAAEHAAFTGAVAELTVDTTNNRVRVHDGVTAGGFEVGIQTGAQIKTLYEAEASAFTDAQFTKLAGVEALADVTDATNVAAALTNGVAALTSGEVTQLANIGTEAISAAEWGYVAAATAAFTSVLETKIDGIEALADVTDVTNVAAAGALMDSEVTNLAQVKAFSAADYATAAQGTLATNALPKAGGALTGAVTTTSTFDGRDVSVDGTKLDGIEALADVTDVTNVTAAGALMDSELAGIAAVKALNQGVATTDSPTFAGLTATTADINGGTIDGTVIGGTTAAASTFTNTNLSALASSIEKTAVDVFVYDTSLDSDGGAWRKRTQGTSWYNETLDTPTRGSRKEFPAVAVIVAESDTVTIYDGDDPALPMWMVFTTGAGGYTLGGDTVTGIATNNGELIAATSGSYRGVNFIADYWDWRDTAGLRVPTTNIANRNGASSSTLVASGAIVNAAVNDVAMTVLPNAPIDAATGLPVPTIAVATNGGTSQIGWDGVGTDNVWDWTPASDGIVYTVDISENGLAIGAGGGVAYKTWQKYSILTADSSTYDFIFDQTSIPARPGTNASTGKTDVIARTDGALVYGVGGGATEHGIVHLKEDPATPANGMVAYTTADYATGWMNGDIKGAWLSDTVAEVVTGAELVTNGTFTTDTTGWSRFTAQGTNLRVRLINNGGVATDFNLWDNVTLRLADPDRSVNANGLAVYGSVTKAAVATGADLVAYSGFSASNYLEQPYNSDLDFGTGDFSIMGWVNGSSISRFLFERIDEADAGAGFAIYRGASDLEFYSRSGATSLKGLTCPLMTLIHFSLPSAREQHGVFQSTR
jgi:hypothetical protein